MAQPMAPNRSAVPPGPSAAPTCATCGRPTTYVEQYARYYCFACARYVELPPPPPPDATTDAKSPSRVHDSVRDAAEKTKVVAGKVGHGIVGGAKGFVSGAKKGFKGSQGEQLPPPPPPPSEPSPAAAQVPPPPPPAPYVPAQQVTSPPTPAVRSQSEPARPGPAASVAAPAPPCGGCGRATTWVPDYHRYYCYSCQRYC